MKRIILIPEILLMSFFVMVILSSCQKEENLTFENFPSNERIAAICGSTETFNIIKKDQRDVLGSMAISNDERNVYVAFYSSVGMNAIRLYYGDCNTIPSNQAQYGNLVSLPSHTSYVYTIAKNSIDSCSCYVARVETNEVGLVSANYCIQECPTGCNIMPGDYKTYGQGKYGSNLKGNNVDTYLLKNFDLVFPNGIQIGCNNTITLTSAYEIMNFLPQGSTPASLTSSFINPQHRINVLAGQVLTLTLNIGFDNFDASFGNASENLQNLFVASGDFQGMTVLQILNESNNLLGGCNSQYSPSQINDIVTAINENFENGIVNGGLLTCP